MDTNGHAAAAGTREAGRSIHLQVGLEQSDATPLRLQCAAWWACGVWPGGTWVAHGQAGGELQSRKYDERWRDEGLSCNSDFTSLARVYEDVFTRGGPTKLERKVTHPQHRTFINSNDSRNRDGVNRCAYIVGYPGAPCRARPQAHRGPGIGTRLGPLALPPPRPSGSLPLVSPRHGRALVGSDQALCTSVHQHPSLRPSSSTTFHLDKSSLSRRFIGD